jgi:hypothetical protein
MLAIVAALALAAQDPAWIATPPPALPGDMYRTMDRYRYFTNCVATRDWHAIGGMFDTPIGSQREQGYLRIAGGDRRGTDCSYAERMRMTSLLMRGGIAESRYRHVYARAEMPAVDAALAPVPQGATWTWVGFNADSAPQALFDFANCLAERETGAVHAVLMTGYGTPEERRAFQALSRRFGVCMRPGQHLQANSLTFRPWLAEAQYQLFRTRQPDPVE